MRDRQEVFALLKLDGLVDLIIPRGSNELVKFIQDNTRIPVLGHADGICHLYVDSDCNIEKALRVAIDSKTQYPAACNSIETLIVHKDVAASFLKLAIPKVESVGVTLRGDSNSLVFGIEHLANEDDWSTEYLEAIISVKIVDGVEEAISHIGEYSTNHTDSIITEDNDTAEKFMREVDSAIVMHNTSTQFADGGEFGMGAEIGIATGRFHARGPVGLSPINI